MGGVSPVHDRRLDHLDRTLHPGCAHLALDVTRWAPAAVEPADSVRFVNVLRHGSLKF
jgi:hypothetical protein